MNTGKSLGIILVCVNSYISLDYDCYIIIIMTNDKISFNILNSCLNVQPSIIFGHITQSKPCTHTYNITSWAPQGVDKSRRSPPPLWKIPLPTFFCVWRV